MIHIIKNKKIPKSVHNKVLILTDLEPDDVLALQMLRKVIPDEVPILVVIGEGNCDKTDMANAIMTKYNYTNYRVVQGQPSSKNFPLDGLSCYTTDQSLRDLSCVTTDQSLRDLSCYTTDQSLRDLKAYGTTQNTNTWSIKRYKTVVATITEFLSPLAEQVSRSTTSAENPLIIGLKPLYELLPISKDILNKCVMLLYGSFNLRTMRSQDLNRTAKEITEFVNTSFKYVIMYESFHATGQANSINRKNAATVFNSLDKELIQLISAWNAYIISENLERVVALSVKMDGRFKTTPIDWHEMKKDYDKMTNRNLKVVGNIIDADGMQMVLADSGLISYVFNDIQSSEVLCGSISMDEMGYTHMSESELGKVYLVTNVDFAELVTGIETLISH